MPDILDLITGVVERYVADLQVKVEWVSYSHSHFTIFHALGFYFVTIYVVAS